MSDVYFSGGAAFTAALSAIEAEIPGATGAAEVATARELVATARSGINSRSGNLAGSFQVFGPRVGPVMVETSVGPTAVYAPRVNFGFNATDSLGRTYHQPGSHYMDRATREAEARFEASFGLRVGAVMAKGA